MSAPFSVLGYLVPFAVFPPYAPFELVIGDYLLAAGSEEAQG
jgi:hypothetical protein